MSSRISAFAPQLLSVLRIMAGLLFFEHGLSKMLGFPHVGNGALLPALSIGWFSGVFEFVGGALVALGLFTRPAAFVLSGEMAVAYFLAHAPRSFFPILNMGEGAILYCFIFLYLVFAGGGPWDLDQLRGNGWMRSALAKPDRA